MKRENQLPIVSAALVAVNALVYFLFLFGGEAIFGRYMLNLHNVIINRRVVCIITAMFMHADINHLLSNMVIVYFLGAMLEKEVGHVRLFVIYFVSGIGGNALSLLNKYIAKDSVPSIGASGAVFGLDGLLLALVLFSGRQMENVTLTRVLLMIVLSIANGMMAENIDNAAHVGGLLTGFICGIILCIAQKRIGERNRAFGFRKG